MMTETPSRRGLLRMLSGASIAAAVRGSPPSGGAAEDRTAWYRAAKFGMFIHWGPYSLASVEASWPIMEPQAGTISEAEYVALSKRFNPTQFDPVSGFVWRAPPGSVTWFSPR